MWLHGWCENWKRGQRARLKGVRLHSKRGAKEKSRTQYADTSMGVGVARESGSQDQRNKLNQFTSAPSHPVGPDDQPD